jgi:hypothetical protein
MIKDFTFVSGCEFLLERQGKIVTRQEIKQILRSTDTVVDFDRSSNVARAILRKALDETGGLLDCRGSWAMPFLGDRPGDPYGTNPEDSQITSKLPVSRDNFRRAADAKLTETELSS